MNAIKPFDAATYVDTVVRLGYKPFVVLSGDNEDNIEVAGFYEGLPEVEHDGGREEYFAARRLYNADPEAQIKVGRELIRRGMIEHTSTFTPPT